jgi:hypothetical protein
MISGPCRDRSLGWWPHHTFKFLTLFITPKGRIFRDIIFRPLRFSKYIKPLKLFKFTIHVHQNSKPYIYIYIYIYIWNKPDRGYSEPVELALVFFTYTCFSLLKHHNLAPIRIHTQNNIVSYGILKNTTSGKKEKRERGSK